MTEPLTLLIVEDETLLAEMHAEYIRHIPGFSQIWLAGNLEQARMMIERFKPGLILLDNYLPAPFPRQTWILFIQQVL